jgi:hypothetical protein
MFHAHVFRRFVDHPALADHSPVITIMNKAHHGLRQEVRAADVAQCADDLSELLELVELMYDECYRWRRRDAAQGAVALEAPVVLKPMPNIALNVVICPDLAAFTQDAPLGESQEALERLDSHLLDGTVAYYLRRPNFGFAAPVGSLAIVRAVPEPAADRRLVIARHGDVIYARRLVRDQNAAVIGLTAEVPDPRARTPKTIFRPENELAIHQVIGVIFDHSLTVPQGKDEAVAVDAVDVLRRVDELGQHRDALVALTLDDGSSIFKRVGSALPGEDSRLRQFESIGGLGSSQVLSIGKRQNGLRTVVNAREIFGVLYNG